MIITTFNPKLSFRYVRYGRMSDEQQNPRSPDQQFDEIDRTKLRQGYDNWLHVRDFRDDGISGRYIRKRPGFREMLDGIRCGLLKVDAILVDTLERLGRAHEIDDIRQELRKRHGVLTADTGFTDPTSTVGRVYGAMEAVRASSAAAQKAHDVLRGKIDTAMLKRWPGGPPPTGYRLAARTELITRRNGKTVENIYHVLEPDPATVGIVHAIYDLAFETGWGRTRIAKELNANEAFVQQYGKVSESLVGSVMTNTIYNGLYRFNFLATDIEDDCRIIRKKDASEVIYVADFCPPIVDATRGDKVRADACRRSEKTLSLRAAKKAANGKQIQPLSQGLILVYPLTGLVRCAKCNASMRPSKSGAKSASADSYYYYRCPCANDDRCDNKLYLRGPWLWKVVIARLRETLFPLVGASGNDHLDWLPVFMAEVRSDLVQRFSQEQGHLPLLHDEVRQIDMKVIGWTETLSKANLSSLVRNQVEQQLGAALERKQSVELELEMLSASNEQVSLKAAPRTSTWNFLCTSSRSESAQMARW